MHTGVHHGIGTGFPGYDSVMGKDTATIAEILKQKGWNTAWFGKDHNVPDWETSQAGPFDLWPTGMGFERFYGFIGGDTNQWRPAVYDGTKPIEPYLGNPDYNFDYDIADQAIQWIRNQKRRCCLTSPSSATTPPAQRTPHTIPRRNGSQSTKASSIRGGTRCARIRWPGRRNWASSRPTPNSPLGQRALRRGTRSTPRTSKLYARLMEIYAGYLEQTDYNVGRVLDEIERLGQLDNTLVIYIVGDNGASSEGGLSGSANELALLNGVPENTEELLKKIDDLGTWKTYNHYPAGWAIAMCTPFQWVKQIASHFGGTRNGLVISWPARIKDKGGLRTQFHHVIDIDPTILDVCGLEQPSSVNGVAQKPIEGVSMAYTFDDAKAVSPRRTQYFEMGGNRAIYHDGWVAATTPLAPPWISIVAGGDVINRYKWELYNIDEDFSEAVNLAAKYPDKLHDLQLLFYAEAAKYNVLPLDDSKVQRMRGGIRPSLVEGRTSFTYYPGNMRIPEGSLPDVKNKSWSLSAEIVVKKTGDQGMIVTQGGLFSGWALYLEQGKPVFHYNFVNEVHTRVAAAKELAPGKHTIAWGFKYDGGGVGKGGTGTLSVDGREVAQARIDHTVPGRFSLDEGLDVGEDTGTPVCEDYEVPFKFTGKIEKVVVHLGQSKLNAAQQQEIRRMEREAKMAVQ